VLHAKLHCLQRKVILCVRRSNLPLSRFRPTVSYMPRCCSVVALSHGMPGIEVRDKSDGISERRNSCQWSGSTGARAWTGPNRVMFWTLLSSSAN